MKHFLKIAALCFSVLNACTKATVAPLEETDDSYFTGTFGRFGGDYQNTPVFPFKLIETVAVIPKYHFVLRLNSENTLYGQRSDHRADVTIFEPQCDEVYVATDVYNNASTNIRYQIMTTLINGESYEIVYVPDPTRIPVRLKIVNLEAGNVLELEAKGWLYNQADPQDSTEVSAKIKTRPLPRRLLLH